MRTKIVIADDSTTVQKVIKLILSPRGYDLESYTNGSDALKSIKDNKPILVIADAVMPGMNGIELGQTMQQEGNDLAQIPLILMHSSFEDIKTDDFLKSGAREKLTKPFDDKKLIAIVEKYVSQQESLDTSNPTWDMESFVKPEIPDIKNPVKTIVKNGGEIDIDVDLEDKIGGGHPPLFKMQDDEKIEDLGIPDVDKFTRPAASEKIMEDEAVEFGPEVISDDEAQKLMEEFKIKENPDGTINFNEMESMLEDSTRWALENIDKLSDPDIGLWSEKYYGQTNVSDPEHKNDILDFDSESESIPSLDTKGVNSDKELIIAVTREVVEKMIRQMLPEIAERVIKEEIKKIVGS